MKCPYCAEKINSDAIVCRYCKRDLVTILPFVKRLDAIDNSIAEIEKQVGNLHRIILEKEIKYADKSPKSQPVSFYLLALLIGGIISVTFYSLYTWIPATRQYALWISLLIPLLVGFWIGLISILENLTNYIAIGIGAGIINSLGVLINLSFYVRTINGKIDYEKVLTLYFLTPFFLIILGCLIGDWIETKRKGRSIPPTYARNAAIAFVKGSPASQEDDEKRVERFAKLMSSLTPILTFLASIISAYLTFQSALHK